MARRILIVDDQEDILLILKREFRRMPNVSVTSTGNVADALRFVAEKQIDLVISDVRLGQESGFDLVREVNRLHRGVASILMSAYRSTSNRQQADDLGVVLFLEKPFQISVLTQTVKEYFDLRENPSPVVISQPVPVATATPEIGKTNSLSHFKLEDLVQLFCLNGRNILITITPTTGQATGEIYIQRGRIVHAEFNGMTGDEGFLALMQLSRPQLKVKDWTSPVPVTVEGTWEHLLLQSAVQTDELPHQRATGSG